jgi:hypothetical protein
MAKRKATGRAGKAKRTKTSAAARRPLKRASRKTRTVKKSGRTRTSAKKKAAGGGRKAARARTRATATRKPTKPLGRAPAADAGTRTKATRLDRARRTLEETVPTPPSSLDMNRRGSAVRTGRAEIAEAQADHAGMTPAITGGDVDTDLEQAYFSGDEAPGGDNPTPDQDIVDDIGRALGVEYQDNEELRASDKVAERDKKRWELDPASSEDYRERKK